MKKISVLIVLFLLSLIMACSSEDISTGKENDRPQEIGLLPTAEHGDNDENNDSSNNQVENKEGKETNEADKEINFDELAQETLEVFYTALLNKDYEKALTYMSPIDNNNNEAVEIMNNIKENDSITTLERTGFMIRSIQDYNPKLKIAEVKIEAEKNGVDASAEDRIILALSENKWLIDFSLVVSQKKLDLAAYTTEDNAVTISNVNVTEHIDGIIISLDFTNNLINNAINFRWTDSAIFRLKTDKGEYIFQDFPLKSKIDAQAQENVTISFVGATGEVESLQISGLRVLNENGLPIIGEDPLTFNVPLIK